MEKKIFFALAFILIAIGLSAIGTQGSQQIVYVQASYRVDQEAFGEKVVSARSWLIFDVETGEVLASRNPEEVLSIASITKLITAETALARFDLAPTTTISWNAVSTDGRAGRLAAGEKILRRDLLFPLLLESSNDAAEAIAESFGRTIFIDAMQSRAEELGMHHTSIKDPSGLSAYNTSTARDLEVLLQYLYVHRRHIFDITTLTDFVSLEHTWRNNSPVFSSIGYIGGKHGFTDTAGRTFAGVFEERFQNDAIRPIGIILLHSDNIPTDVLALRDAIHAHITYETRLR